VVVPQAGLEPTTDGL